MRELVLEFFNDPRTQGLISLIILNVVTGISAALRLRTFDWRRVADFTWTTLTPFIVGYSVLWFFFKYGVSSEIGSELVQEVAATLGFAPMAAVLTHSIVENVEKFKNAPARVDSVDLLSVEPVQHTGSPD